MCVKVPLVWPRLAATFVVLVFCAGCSSQVRPPVRAAGASISEFVSGSTTDKRTQARIVESGERSVADILQQMRVHADDPGALYRGWLLIREMAKSRTAAPSAPLVRKVMADTTWPAKVRAQAALMLYWFADSSRVREAIDAQAAKRPRPSDVDYSVWERAYLVRTAYDDYPDGADAGVVRQRLRTAAANITSPLDVEGEPVLATILNEFDANPRASSLAAIYIVQHMVLLNTADPDAPAIRAALTDVAKRVETRELAAKLLGLFGHSQDVCDALAECVGRDSSVTVRSACVASLARVINIAGARTRWRVSPEAIRALREAIHSPDRRLHDSARAAVESIEWSAKSTSDVKLGWTRKLLSEADGVPTSK